MVLYRYSMGLYLILAPLTPVIILISARAITPRHHGPVAIAGLLCFAPAAIISTIIRGQFQIMRASFGAHIVRVFMSDYLIQISLLILLIMLLMLIDRQYQFSSTPSSTIAIFVGMYFFSEALYRMFFVPVVSNTYELFIFPTLRLILSLAIQTLFLHSDSARRLMMGGGCILAIMILSAIIGTLFWFKFLIMWLVILILCAIVTVRVFARAQNAV